MGEHGDTGAAIAREVSESVRRGDDIRGRVRELTLQALRSRRLDMAAMREVVGAVSEGIHLGAAERAGDVRQALSDAFHGMDDALTQSAQATRLALEQLMAQGREFGDGDLRRALDELKTMEGEFLGVVGRVAESAGARVRQEFKDLVLHARRSGTDTGARVAQTVSDLGGRLTRAAVEGQVAGVQAAQEFSLRLAALASGVLAGMADALHEKSRSGKS